MKLGGIRAADLRRSSVLSDPSQVVSLLGLGDGAIRQGSRGLKIRCPAHADSTPSCSVREGDDGTLQVRCFGCSLRGDVFSLIAAVHGLDVRQGFVEIKRIAAELAGMSASDTTRPPAALRTHPPAHFPPTDEVAALWAACVPVLKVRPVADWLCSRGLDPGVVEDFDLARAIPESVALPSWAGQGGRSWLTSGHRAILPLFDSAGALRSLRARRVVDNAAPKTLAPRGCQTTGLVMADVGGRAILRGAKSGQPTHWPDGSAPLVVVTEGDPDFMTWGTRFSDADEAAPATFGIFSGSWSPAIAARVPDGTRVSVRTDHDDAGDRYAAVVIDSLRSRCPIFRSRAA